MQNIEHFRIRSRSSIEMNEHLEDRRARLPGILWLATAVTGGFGLFVIRNSILVPNDAPATIANVQASETLFRLALTSTLVSQVIAVFFAIQLYKLFRSSSHVGAMVVTIAVLITAAFAAFNTLLHFAALFLLNNANLLSGFTSEQIASLAYASIRIANGPGQGIIELFWPVTHFTLGLLVIRTKVVPVALGYLLMIAAFGFLLNITNKYLFPWYYPAQFTILAQALGALCVLPNILWWSIRGVRVTPRT